MSSRSSEFSWSMQARYWSFLDATLDGCCSSATDAGDDALYHWLDQLRNVVTSQVPYEPDGNWPSPLQPLTMALTSDQYRTLLRVAEEEIEGLKVINDHESVALGEDAICYLKRNRPDEGWVLKTGQC